MGEKKKIIFFIVFTFLMLIKVSAFHVYTHHDTNKTSIENCKWCVVAVENQQAEHQLLTIVEAPTVSLVVLVEPILEVEAELFLGSPHKSCLFSRPPPSIHTLG